jgi:16S rRNA (cytosine1402-N4)-methyltransferase
MEELNIPHIPVMLNEVKEILSPREGGLYLDCTFGFGGYTKMMLEAPNSNVVAIDRDPNVQAHANKLMDNYPDRMRFVLSDFAGSFTQLGGLKFDGIVMDLGASSMQFDSGERGFSFTYDGPLDMRMSTEGMSATDFINSADEEEIANVIYQYGDETYSRRIAKKIVEQRKLSPITNTARLANIVRTSIGYRKGKIDSATKTFQAIRIYINDELGQLERFLDSVKDILAPNGVIITVSFHSLEDRIIKNFFKDNSAKLVSRSKYAPKENIDPTKWLKIITKKPLSPSREELRVNPRSRSAKLRAGQKIENNYVS